MGAFVLLALIVAVWELLVNQKKSNTNVLP